MTKLDLSSSQRPRTTLFLLSSVDGKISTGATDGFDFDQDIPTLLGSEGLEQYYEIERGTELWSLCTGKTQEKVLKYATPWPGPKVPITLVVLDNTNLSSSTYQSLCTRYNRVVLATSNPKRYTGWEGAVHGWVEPKDLIVYPKGDLKGLLEALKARGCDALTVQSGGTLNTALMRAGLIDNLDIVVAPILVGGKSTPSVMSGEDVTSLSDIATLRLCGMFALDRGYVRLQYEVVGSASTRG